MESQVRRSPALQSACLIRSATINIVSKHRGQPCVPRDCELVSLSPAAWPRTLTLTSFKDPSGGPGVPRLPSPGSHRRTVTLTSRWKSREYGNTGGLCASVLTATTLVVMPGKRLSLSPFSSGSSIRVSPPDVVVFSASRPALRA